MYLTDKVCYEVVSEKHTLVALSLSFSLSSDSQIDTRKDIAKCVYQLILHPPVLAILLSHIAQYIEYKPTSYLKVGF